MSDLVGNPEDRFSRVAAHFVYMAKMAAMTIDCMVKTLQTSSPEPVGRFPRNLV